MSCVTFLCLTTAISFAATAGVAAVPRHFVGANLLPLAKVSLAKARSTALAARPGQITDQELEKERGGTGLRYSFDVKSHGKGAVRLTRTFLRLADVCL